MPEVLEEVEAYKHILKLAEELLQFAGLPAELLKKYSTVKERTLQKIRMTKADLESPQSSSSQGSKAIIDDFSTLLEHLCSSQVSLIEKLHKYIADVENKPSTLDVFSSFSNFGLLKDNKHAILGKFSAFRGRQDYALKDSYEGLMATHINRFERLEAQSLDTISQANQILVSHAEATKKNEYQLEALHTTEQKLKLEIDMLISKISQSKQMQSIELLEKNQELTGQLDRAQERIESLRISHTEEIKRLHSTYEIHVSELKERVYELESQLQSTSSENEARNRDRLEEVGLELAEKSKQNDSLFTIIKAMRAELKPLYDKHVQTHYKSFDNNIPEKARDENLDLISFIGYLLQKFESDNVWLVEKLTELSSEKEDWKSKYSLVTSSRDQQKQELDAIFRQLRTELQDSKYAFMEWEGAIDALKRCLDEDDSAVTSGRTTQQ